jgi:NACHT conflict system protein/pentapeptide repeat protein
MVDPVEARSGQPAAPQPHPTAEIPKTLWQQPLKADFKSFFKSLGKGVAHGLAGKKEDVIADAVEAATAIGVTTPPEQLAWRLVERSLRRAVSALVVEASDVFLTLEISEEKAEQIGDRIEQAMENVSVKLDRDFFERPGDMPVVQWLQRTLTQWLLDLGLKSSKAEGLSARLPSYFTFAVQEEWRKHRTTYQSLRDSLDSPFARASEREEQWNFYTAWLTRQADQRMFDETFSVRQVYVRPRATFAKKKTKDRSVVGGPVDPDAGKERVVWLDECLAAWLQKWDGDDAIRVISGGPGSGKSVFARLFAADVSRRGKSRVIYVPLHLFELKADLIAAVHGFCDGNEYLPKGVLDPKDGEPKLLLIFDGLDELEKQGRMATQVASEFVAEVSRAVDRLNQIESHIMVLMFGRPVAVQAGETVLRLEEQILQLLPYVLTAYEARSCEDPLNLLPTDQRNEWWSKYGKCIGKDYAQLPDSLRRDEFREITAQPLLNYLVALSFDRGKLNFKETINLNVVYRDLLDAVYERAYERRVNRSVQGLSRERFVRVLEEIGLAAWHGDGRTTTVRKIEARCGKSKALHEALKQFAGDAEAGVTRLLTAFYFRQHGDIDGEKTFEFTHKSFGEYLTACRIVRELRLIHQKLLSQDAGDEGGFDELQSLERCIDLCGPSEITHELHRFLRQEIATRSVEDAKDWQKSCVRLINHLLRHGMPMEKLSPLPTFKELDRQSRNAEESLLAILHVCAEKAETISNISWPEVTSFGAWHSRLAQQRDGPRNRVASASMSWIRINNQNFDIQDFYGSNIARSHAENCQANMANLSRANLTGANLTGANLTGANLTGANLTGAHLNRAHLNRANLTEANLTGVDLTGADLIRADLTRADLTRANLTEADLTEANLTGANLTEANLTRANLTEANLTRAHLTRANLKGAKNVKISLFGRPRRRTR